MELIYKKEHKIEWFEKYGSVSVSGYGSGSDYGYGSGYGSSDSLWAVELEHDQEKLLSWYLKESNAEVRAKITEKIGLEPILLRTQAKLKDSKTLPVGGYYELYECEMFDQKRKFLKMINPSTGIFHMEWIPPNIADVLSAIKWRNYGYLPDDIS